MLDRMYPFYASLIACVLAQILKPFCFWLRHRKWHNYMFFAAGGFPSSHVALVSALSLSVGLVEKFSSTIFAVTLAFSCIVAFDAANVRYYAGQNIRLTRQMLDDLIEQGDIDPTSDPIYSKRMKEVLGHTKFEVLGGAIVGMLTSYIYYVIVVGG